jgi:hypothetical protein
MRAVRKDLHVLDECWITFVRHLERCWYKTQAHMKGNSKWQGWSERGHIERQRKEDPLLSYLLNARGAEEHGISDLSVKQMGRLRILRPDEPPPEYIQKVTGLGGRVTQLMNLHDGRISAVEQQGQFLLIPVVDRGITYAVPTVYKGQPLAGSDAVTVASAGAEFYSKTLDRIESEFFG